MESFFFSVFLIKCINTKVTDMSEKVKSRNLYVDEGDDMGSEFLFFIFKKLFRKKSVKYFDSVASSLSIITKH